MAGEAFTVQIGNDLGEKVKASAAAQGISIQMFVREALVAQLFGESADSSIDDEIAEETLRRGDGIPWEKYRDRFESFGQRKT